MQYVSLQGLEKTATMAYKRTEKKIAKCIREVEANEEKTENEEDGEDCVRATSNDDSGFEGSGENSSRKELIEGVSLFDCY